MDFEEVFPIWDKLEDSQKQRIQSSLISRTYDKGEIIHSHFSDCTGLVVVKSGQLRAFMISDEGREITLYRLFNRSICLLSASCMMSSILFEITIQAEKETQVWIIPTDLYKKLMLESIYVANFTTTLMGERFTEVMYLIENLLWKKLDSRLAHFLLNESKIENKKDLSLTHESIANHLGTHREVVTRLLKYFQEESIVKLSRGTITILDTSSLEYIAEK